MAESLALLTLLLEASAQLELRNSFGATALCLAVEAAAVPHAAAADSRGADGLVEAAPLLEPELDEFSSLPRLANVDALLAQRADPNAQEMQDGTSPLMQASCAGDVALCRCLVAARADPELRCWAAGFTAVDFALAGEGAEHRAVVDLLGAVGCAGEMAFSPESRCAEDAVQLLLDDGIRAMIHATAASPAGQSPSLAASWDVFQTASLALQDAVARGGNLARCPGAAELGGLALRELCAAATELPPPTAAPASAGAVPEAAAWLLAAAAEVNGRDSEGRTALHLAVGWHRLARGAEERTLSLTRVLIEHRADINAGISASETCEGTAALPPCHTALLQALTADRPELCTLLLESGADGLVAPALRI